MHARPRASAASTSQHPEARYFSVGRIGARPGRGLRRRARASPVAEVERWLAPEPRLRAEPRRPPARGESRRSCRYPRPVRAPARRSLFRMRTTLKRGIGRGARRQRQRPSAVSRRRRSRRSPCYRQPPRRPARSWRSVGRVLAWWLLALLVLVALGLGRRASTSAAPERRGASRPHSTEVKVAAEAASTSPLPGQPAIALVDRLRPARTATGVEPSRSDTMMLLRADPATKSISMLSFPRDLLVDDPLPGERRADLRRPDQHRLRALRARAASLETVKHLTGLPINYLITVNFRGFTQIVDQARRRLDRRRPPLLQRQRRHGGDELRRHRPPARLPAAQRASRRSTSSASGTPTPTSTARAPAAVREGAQAAGRGELLGLSSCRGSSARSRRATSRSARRRGGDSRADDLAYALFALRPAARALLPGEDRPEPRSATTRAHASPSRRSRTPCSEFVEPGRRRAATRRPRSRSAARPSGSARAAAEQATITVLNGNGVAGAAANAAYLLGQRGYRSSAAGRAAANAPTSTTSTRRSTTTAAQPDARGRGAARSRSSSATPTSSRCRPSSGRSRTGRWSPSSSARPSTGRSRRRRSTRRRRSASRRRSRRDPARDRSTLLRRCSKRLPFPLMVPTVLESASNLDARRRRCASTALDEGEPARPAHVPHGRRHADYWGIQETQLGRRAGPRGARASTQRDRGPRLRPLLHRPAPAHGRAARTTARPTGS